MQSFTNFDDELKQTISDKVLEINPSDNLFIKINEKIRSQNKEDHYMKLDIAKKTRGILIACILVIITTGACFAATKIADYTGSLDYKFESYPSQSQMKKAAGFVPKYVDEFENGYKFEKAFVGEYEGQDSEKNTTQMLKSADFTYLKDDAEIYLYAMEKPDGTEFDNNITAGKEIAVSDSQSVYYYDYLNKLKPGDYVMTEQDKLDEANGTYVFSFGENYDCVKHIQMVGWEDDGVIYSLECYDDNLTEKQLLNMVNEIIENK